MEYFNFEDAANVQQQEDEFQRFLASAPALDTFHPDGADFLGALPGLSEIPMLDAELPMTSSAQPMDTEMAGFDDFSSWIPGCFKPAVACDYCRSRQLECLVIHKGQQACTSCITLFRSCSFLGTKDTGYESLPDDSGGIDTLHGVVEDTVIQRGETVGCRSLRSTLNMNEESGSLERKARKTGTRFSREAVRTLKNWLNEHSDHPYPTDDEKNHLKMATGLKRSQISNWLANARRRGKVPNRCVSPGLGGGAYERSSNSGARGIAIPSPVDPSSWKEMNPLERWKHSPPEREAAAVHDIVHAVATSGLRADKATPDSGICVEGQKDSSAGSSFSVFRAPSMTSVETGRSSGSDMSFSSLFSHQSRHSYGSSKDRRRRRRQPLSQQPSTSIAQPRTFQCTFCTDSFKTKHDWSRHEKSLHLSLEKWTCAPQGGLVSTILPNGSTSTTCVYCHAIDPPLSHLETHNYSSCREKSSADRTFYRKDHLRQHLRLTHACTFLPSMESWRIAPPELRSRCGFCPADVILHTWQARVDHLAKHFRAGANMADWHGDWGFSAPVLRMIENAMPPWLLSQERKAPVPLSAEALNRNAISPDDADIDLGPPRNGVDVVADARHCYRRLELGLRSFVREERQAGRKPSDRELQEKARWVVYGETDSWNQTAADNEVWLERFRRATGLDSEEYWNWGQEGLAGGAKGGEEDGVGGLEEQLMYCNFGVEEDDDTAIRGAKIVV